MRKIRTGCPGLSSEKRSLKTAWYVDWPALRDKWVRDIYSSFSISPSGEIKGGPAFPHAISLKTEDFINWWGFKGKLIFPRVSHSLSRDSRAGVPWIHCKGGEGAALLPGSEGVSVDVRAQSGWTAVSSSPGCVLSPWANLLMRTLKSVSFFITPFSLLFLTWSLLIFCFYHISKRSGWGFFWLDFLLSFLNDCFYFSLVCEWNTYRRKHPLMAVITRKRTPKSKEN